MFRGITEIQMDDKGRMAIPSRYRLILKTQAKNSVVLTIDTEQHCLLLYPFPKWEEIENKITQLPSFDPATRRIQRLLIGHATELNLDKSGRILLPALLREYAGITDSVVLVGQGYKFEIWATTLWKKNRERWLAKESNLGAGIPEALKSISL